MRWQTKAKVQEVLSTAPGGELLYYLMQRYVSRSLPPREQKFIDSAAVEMKHLDAFQRYGDRPLSEATFYQFGAGWTLAGPLLFYCQGVNHQILVDIRRLMRPALVNTTIERLRTVELETPLLREAPEPVSSRSAEAIVELQERCGIEYYAPMDARRTTCPDNSVDCITSTNTLEHIPREDIAEILKECYRILRPGGVMSFQVDYQDHYSYCDPDISVYNFLKFSDGEWARFNPGLHYQNRMRHPDYLDLYSAAGFQVVQDDPLLNEAEDFGVLEEIPLDARFAQYDQEELAIRRSYIVLRSTKLEAPAWVA